MVQPTIISLPKQQTVKYGSLGGWAYYCVYIYTHTEYIMGYIRLEDLDISSYVHIWDIYIYIYGMSIEKTGYIHIHIYIYILEY